MSDDIQDPDRSWFALAAQVKFSAAYSGLHHPLAAR